MAANRTSFVKGDPRCWRKGRPKSFDALRELAREIAHEKTTIVVDGHAVTVAEAILRQWASSKNPILQQRFIEVAFGKVPDELKVSGTTIVNLQWSEDVSGNADQTD